jgi:hypothetical protein
VLAKTHRVGRGICRRRGGGGRQGAIFSALLSERERESACAWSRCLCATDGERERGEEADINSSIDPEAWSIYLLFHEIRKHSTGCPQPLPPSLLSLFVPCQGRLLYWPLLYRCCGLCVRRGCALMQDDLAVRLQTAVLDSLPLTAMCVCVCAPDSLVMLILALPQ